MEVGGLVVFEEGETSLFIALIILQSHLACLESNAGSNCLTGIPESHLLVV